MQLRKAKNFRDLMKSTTTAKLVREISIWLSDLIVFATASNLRSVSEFQQNYYEGNAIASWDELDPHFFAHTEDVDIGIDSFLSFGTFAPKQSELRTHLSGTEYPIETGSKQSSQSMSLPALTSVAPSKRYEPIPQGAEVITLDDSDDDGEDSVEVIPPLNAILEMVTEPGTRHPEEPEVAEESQTSKC